jgi:ubiquinol-cytochrome c reductase cytochrome b subunit
VLGLLEGLFGYSLPDDQLSGAGLRIFEGVLQGIPIVGTYIAFFLFGGAFPGTSIVPRLYIIHVLVIPGLILALVTAHLFIMFHQKHTQMPALGNTEKNVVGQPFWPYFLLKGQAWFFFIFGALVLLATFAQINPIWLYGPYSPLNISSASQPDWYMGILEGALRIMPAWEINFLGHTLTLSVFIPFAVPLGIIFGGAALWPFFEQWATGDKTEHHVNDRPRNAPVRTGVGVAAVAFYGVLWAEGANDVLADKFQIPLYTITWIARIAVFVVPIGGYFITKRICLGLQRKDTELLTHGVEIGIIRQLPSGEFIEEARPLEDDERAIVGSKKLTPALPLPGQADENGVPAPGSGGLSGWARSVANRAFAETVVLPEGHADGHDGHGGVTAHEPAEVGIGHGPTTTPEESAAEPPHEEE